MDLLVPFVMGNKNVFPQDQFPKQKVHILILNE